MNDLSKCPSEADSRILHCEAGAVAMTYVVLAVLLVAAAVAAVIVFSGALSGGTETAGHAVGGQLSAAGESAVAARENHEAASVRAMSAMTAIQGGELALSRDSGGGDAGNAKEDEPKRLNEHKVNHPVAVEIGHTVLDLAGLIPGIGDAVDLANAAWYEKDARHVEAVITAAAAVPVAGTAAVAVKWGNNAAKLAKLVFKDGKLVKVITKEGKVIEKEGGKIAKDAGKGASKETGKTGGNVAEKTTEKNSGDVIDINAKRAEKNGNPDNVAAKKVKQDNVIDARGRFGAQGGHWEKTGTGDDVFVRDNTVYDSMEIPRNNSRGHIYRQDNSSVSSTKPYNPDDRFNGDISIREKTASEQVASDKGHEKMQREDWQKVIDLKKWEVTHQKNGQAQKYNDWDKSRNATEQYGKQTGQGKGNPKANTDNNTP